MLVENFIQKFVDILLLSSSKIIIIIVIVLLVDTIVLVATYQNSPVRYYDELVVNVLLNHQQFKLQFCEEDREQQKEPEREQSPNFEKFFQLLSSTTKLSTSSSLSLLSSLSSSSTTTPSTSKQSPLSSLSSSLLLLFASSSFYYSSLFSYSYLLLLLFLTISNNNNYTSTITSSISSIILIVETVTVEGAIQILISPLLLSTLSLQFYLSIITVHKTLSIVGAFIHFVNKQKDNTLTSLDYVKKINFCSENHKIHQRINRST